MELAFVVYLVNQVDSLSEFLINLSNLLGVVCIIMGATWAFIKIASIEIGQPVFKFSKWALIVPIVLFVITSTSAALIPSSKTAQYMAAAYAAQTIYEDPDAKRIASKVIKAIEAKIDEVAEE